MGIALWVGAGVAAWGLVSVATAFVVGHATIIAGGPRHLLVQEATTVTAENLTPTPDHLAANTHLPPPDATH